MSAAGFAVSHARRHIEEAAKVVLDEMDQDIERLYDAGITDALGPTADKLSDALDTTRATAFKLLVHLHPALNGLRDPDEDKGS